MSSHSTRTFSMWIQSTLYPHIYHWLSRLWEARQRNKLQDSQHHNYATAQCNIYRPRTSRTVSSFTSHQPTQELCTEISCMTNIHRCNPNTQPLAHAWLLYTLITVTPQTSWILPSLVSVDTVFVYKMMINHLLPTSFKNNFIHN